MGWTIPTPALPILSTTVPTAMNSRRRLISLTQSPSSPASSRTSTVWPWLIRCSCCGIGGHLAEGEGDLVEGNPGGAQRLAGRRPAPRGRRACRASSTRKGPICRSAAARRGGRRSPGRRRGRGRGRGRRCPRSRRAGSAAARPSMLAHGGELVDGDLLGLLRHLLAAAGQLVELDPLDLLGGVGGRLLLDLPSKRCIAAATGGERQRRYGHGRRLGGHLARGVVGVGRDAEADRPPRRPWARG